MDREQHLVQDAAEHYAVYRMQLEAERLGIEWKVTSEALRQTFLDYLASCGLTFDAFDLGKYGQYKSNADKQLPLFVARLAALHPGARMDFRNVEAEYRNLGRKGDFTVAMSDSAATIGVSLKNYIGKSGVARPQVASGTFASFAASFIFERVGVGQYADPRNTGSVFHGKNVATREDVLRWMGLPEAISPLRELDAIQADVRAEFLGDDCRFYDAARVARAAKHAAERGIVATTQLFEIVGLDAVRRVLLARIGLDGKEEALFFDADRYVDSLTSPLYHDLRLQMNEASTIMKMQGNKQNLSISFDRFGDTLLRIDVPFTINTNGAWYRPKPPYEGTRVYNDKNHLVDLAWGERRPYKSKEIATSVNTYVNLTSLGLFR